MKLAIRFILFLLLGLILTSFPYKTSAAITRLGGMDLGGYCNSQKQGTVVLTNNAWSCTGGLVISMTSACQWQYPNRQAAARQDITNNPYSWSCYYDDGTTVTPPTTTPLPVFTNTPTPTLTAIPSSQNRLGGMNLYSYCMNLNQGGSQLVNTTSWQCDSGAPIVLDTACQWQYKVTSLAVQETANNPYTWACYTSTAAETPTSNPTTKPVATTTPSATPTPSLRIRKNIYSLSTTELQRLVNAINTLRANGGYQNFIDRHMETMAAGLNIAHRGPAFLAWHRAFLNEFEAQLRTIDPTVTIPYWDFANEPAGTLPKVLTAAYFGGDGNPAKNDRVIDGPFASWNIIRRVGRDPDGVPSLPTSSAVALMMSNTFYDQAPWDQTSSGFDEAMEGWGTTWGVHNRVHGYIGGDMLTMGSPNDPIFWIIHANVDRLWAQWQQTNGITNYQPVSGGPSGQNLNDTMQFLNQPTTPASVLNIQTMGYVYN